MSSVISVSGFFAHKPPWYDFPFPNKIDFLQDFLDGFHAFYIQHKIESIMLKRGLGRQMSWVLSLIYPEHAEGLICTGWPQFSLYDKAVELSKHNVWWLFLLIARCLNLQLVIMTCRDRWSIITHAEGYHPFLLLFWSVRLRFGKVTIWHFHFTSVTTVRISRWYTTFCFGFKCKIYRPSRMWTHVCEVKVEV